MDLSGKTALVTGASRGIGRACAIALHQAGATIGISARNEDLLRELASELGDDRVYVLPAELGVEGAEQALVKAAMDAMGGISILVNSAGITVDMPSILMSEDKWKSVIGVNLTSPFLLAKYCLKPMKKAGGGRIINITSLSAYMTPAGQANYAAAKAGLEAVSRVMAKEVGSMGITVNSVAPGFVETDMLGEALQMMSKVKKVSPEEVRQELIAMTPSGRLATPEDIAYAVLFLADDRASQITGTTIHINGGMAMP